MANLWDQFDQTIDTEGLAKDVQAAANNKGKYREVPFGTYEVAVDKLELIASKRGQPMVSCWMKIVSGEYKGSRLFMNQVITQGFQIDIANKFIRALVSEMDEPISVEFHTYNQYGNLLMDVAEAINDNFEYAVRYYDNKGYSAYEVEGVYILE